MLTVRFIGYVLPELFGIMKKSKMLWVFYNPGQNICKKIEKSSNIGQEKKSLISILTLSFAVIAKVNFLEERFSTRPCLYPNLRFF